jgi:hypothetical protein
MAPWSTEQPIRRGTSFASDAFLDALITSVGFPKFSRR